ncbi:MAG: purine-binding chemotaxis protein CheW [Bacteroidales bacterium]|nr:purine-binding chemotaxis protein CheW [Bacteroidales bacterium]
MNKKKINWEEIERKFEKTSALLHDDSDLSEVDAKIILKGRTQDFAKDNIKIQNSENIEILTFELGNENYCIDSAFVNEVLTKQKITSIPCTPEYIKGVTNVRGKIHTVIDVRKFFDLEQEDDQIGKTIIVVNASEVCTSILVDKMSGISTINQCEIKAPMAVFDERSLRYTKGITSNGLIFLDIGKILSDEKLCVNENIN